MIITNEEFIAISKANFVLSLRFLNYNKVILNKLQERCRYLRNQIIHHEDTKGEKLHLLRKLNKTLKQFTKQGKIIAKQKTNHINNRNGRHYQIEFFEYIRK